MNRDDPRMVSERFQAELSREKTVEIFMQEFGMIRVEVVDKYIDKGRFIMDTYDGIDFTVNRSRSLEKRLVKLLADKFRAAPSLEHLRQFVRKDLGKL